MVLPNLSPTNITVMKSGATSLALSWPADYTGWRLLEETNPPGVGLTTNWVYVSGSSGTNQWGITVDETVGSAFYQLVFP